MPTSTFFEQVYEVVKQIPYGRAANMFNQDKLHNQHLAD